MAKWNEIGQTWNISGRALELVNVGRKSTLQHVVNPYGTSAYITGTCCGKRSDESVFSSSIDFDEWEPKVRGQICKNCLSQAFRLHLLTIWQPEQPTVEVTPELEAEAETADLEALANDPEFQGDLDELDDEEQAREGLIRDMMAAGNLTREQAERQFELDAADEATQQAEIDRLVQMGLSDSQIADILELETGVRPEWMPEIDAPQASPMASPDDLPRDPDLPVTFGGANDDEADREMGRLMRSAKEQMARFVELGRVNMDNEGNRRAFERIWADMLGELGDLIFEEGGW